MPGTAGKAEGEVRPTNRSGLRASLLRCFTHGPVLHTPSWGEGQPPRRLKNLVEHIQPESHLISTLSP